MHLHVRPAPSGSPRHLILGLAAVLLALVAAARLSPGASPAAAAVEHQRGFMGTVLGWTSWYGNYGMGQLGPAWCIDHGSRAPDAAFAYAPSPVEDQSAATTTAIAWIVGRHGVGTEVDDVSAAAVMLALHDLMGASYPYGRLDLDSISIDSLAGFGGAERDVLERAREYKAEGLAHAALVGPYQLSLTAPRASSTGETTVTVRLTDAAGAAIVGEAVSLRGDGDKVAFANGTTHATVTTAADGTAMVTATLASPAGTVEAMAELPDLALHAYASTTTPAQRVAVPVTTQVNARVDIDRELPGSITIRKTGDDEPYLPVTRAAFAVFGAGPEPLGELTVGPAGTTPPLEVPAGHYRVVEIEAPAGYEQAGPWELHVAPGQAVTLEAANRARRGAASIIKVDEVTHEQVAGAMLHLAFDADNDGSFETGLPDLMTDAEPIDVSGLMPGNYELTEVTPPAGYAGLQQPVVFAVGPGATAHLLMTNQPRATVGFMKVVPDDDGPVPSRAGAVFEVATPEGAIVGSCTTDESGRCTLEGLPLVGGARYCWREAAAPPGWGTAEPGCFDAGPAGSATVVRVVEPLLPPTPTTVVRVPTPAPVPIPTPAPPLPRTGAGSLPLAAGGAGLVLIGGALMRLRPRDR